MEMEDEQGKKLCDDEIVDNIVSLVVAGYESTANAIMWAAYHLAKSPHALHKLRVSYFFAALLMQMQLYIHHRQKSKPEV